MDNQTDHQKNKNITIREIVYYQDEERFFGDIFVYEPENVDEQKLGNLFIIGELKELPRNCSYIINLLASKIKKEFYSNTKRTTEESFEAGLVEANNVLSDIAQQGNGEYISKLSMICGTYQDNKFYLSQVGEVKSLLIRDKKISEIMKSDTKITSINRVFNNIASGELTNNDLIILTTTGLFNIFTTEKLNQLSLSLNIDELTKQIHSNAEEKEQLISTLLLKIHTAHSFSTLPQSNTLDTINHQNKNTESDAISHNNTPVTPVIKPTITTTTATTQSLPTTTPKIAKKQTTEEPQTVAELKQQIINEEIAIKKISLQDVIKEYEKKERVTSRNTENLEKGLDAIMNTKNKTGFTDLDDTKSKNIIQKTLHYLKSWIQKTKNYTYNVKPSMPGISTHNAKKLHLLPKKSYPILIAGVFVAIIIINSHLQTNKKQAQTHQQLKHYETILIQAREKIDQAEIELIAKSPKNAGKLLLEAQEMAIQVKKEFNQLDQQAENIINQTQTEINQIDLVQQISNPTILNDTINNESFKILDIQNAYYLVHNNGEIYTLNITTKKIESLAKPNITINQVRSVANLQNKEIIFADTLGLISFNLSNKQYNRLNTDLKPEHITDLTAYGKYIYALSAPQNQIYKLQITNNKVSATNWLKAGDIKNTKSFTIDQYIYLLTDNGEVKKYFIGSEFLDVNNKKFTTESLLKPITSSNKIINIPEKKYLFILETTQNRIIVFDKQTGQLIKQFTSEHFTNIQDIAINNTETNITILTSNKILQIKL